MAPINAAARDAVRRMAYTANKMTSGPQYSAAMTVCLDPTRGSTADLKQATVNRFEEWLALGERLWHPPQHDNDQDGAVVLVSRSLAGWLDDDAFMARLLASVGLSRAQQAKLSVLSGAVDEVPRYDRRTDFFASSEGVSILRGNAFRMFPSPKGVPVGTASDATPSLRFQPPPVRHFGPLGVTVPLANTIFANGRSHTLYASRWEPGPGLIPVLRSKDARTRQTVAIPGRDLAFYGGSRSTVVSRLLAVTPPRRVVQSLGNILSRVEIDDQPVPASQELEAAIPALLASRRKLRAGGLHPEETTDVADRAGADQADNDTPNGPIGVWALVIPGEYMESGYTRNTPMWAGGYCSKTELKMTLATAAVMIDQHLARGCRLYKILSGGGGWGEKRGLLSLDPQTEPTTDEGDDQALARFQESFLNGGGGGLVPPGSHVQFFVEAAYPREDEWRRPEPRLWDPAETSEYATTVFGTPGAVVVPGTASPADHIRSFPALFGAVSATGVHLSKKNATTTSTTTTATGATAATPPTPTIKLDTPRTYLISQERFSRVPCRPLNRAERMQGRRSAALTPEEAGSSSLGPGRGPKVW